MNKHAIHPGDPEQMILQEEAVLYGGLSLLYRFIAERCMRQTRYLISIELRGERADSYLGEDLLRAWEVYSKIVRGAVTPCSLREVLEDLKVV